MILSQEVQRSDQQASSNLESKGTSNVCGFLNVKNDVHCSGQNIDLTMDRKSFSTKEQDAEQADKAQFEKCS